MPRTLIAISFVALACVWGTSAYCQDSEGALGDPLPPPTQDPPHTPSHYFPPALVTAGTADAGPALSMVREKAHNTACSTHNPCALPTPARDQSARLSTG